MLTNPLFHYDICVGDPISRLLTVRSTPVQHSVLNVKVPNRGLLRDCENRLWNQWIVLQHYTRHWEVWAPTGSSHTQISLDILYLLPTDRPLALHVSTPYSRHYYLHKLGERSLWKYAVLFAFRYFFSQCISTFALTLIEMERQGNAQTSPVFVEDLENLVSRVTGTLCRYLHMMIIATQLNKANWSISSAVFTLVR